MKILARSTAIENDICSDGLIRTGSSAGKGRLTSDLVTVILGGHGSVFEISSTQFYTFRVSVFCILFLLSFFLSFFLSFLVSVTASSENEKTERKDKR